MQISKDMVLKYLKNPWKANTSGLISSWVLWINSRKVSLIFVIFLCYKLWLQHVQLTPWKRCVAIALLKEGFSIQKVVKNLNYLHTTVLRMFKLKFKTGDNAKKSGLGRKRTTTIAVWNICTCKIIVHVNFL